MILQHCGGIFLNLAYIAKNCSYFNENFVTDVSLQE